MKYKKYWFPYSGDSFIQENCHYVNNIVYLIYRVYKYNGERS